MPMLIPTKKIQAVCDPYRVNPWQYWKRLTRKDVRAAIKEKRLHAVPYSLNAPESGDNHEERIAWLVVNGWADPIRMDVGVPALGCHVNWPVQDGNHRLAAAIYRKDESILASVDGDIDYAFDLFGVDVAE